VKSLDKRFQRIEARKRVKLTVVQSTECAKMRAKKLAKRVKTTVSSPNECNIEHTKKKELNIFTVIKTISNNIRIMKESDAHVRGETHEPYEYDPDLFGAAMNRGDERWIMFGDQRVDCDSFELPTAEEAIRAVLGSTTEVTDHGSPPGIEIALVLK